MTRRQTIPTVEKRRRRLIREVATNVLTKGRAKGLRKRGQARPHKRGERRQTDAVALDGRECERAKT